MSATGQIDSRRASSRVPAAISRVHRRPIKGTLERDFGLPVTVANDANCMTLGEVWVGAAKGYTDVIGVTPGHRRRRRHPDRRTSAGGCARPWRRAGAFPPARAGRCGLHLRGHRLLGALRRHHGAGARRPEKARLEGRPRHFCRRRGGQRDRAGAAGRMDGRDRPGPCRHGAHLQPAADPDRRRRVAQQKLLIDPMAAQR